MILTVDFEVDFKPGSAASEALAVPGDGARFAESLQRMHGSGSRLAGGVGKSKRAGLWRFLSVGGIFDLSVV